MTPPAASGAHDEQPLMTLTAPGDPPSATIVDGRLRGIETDGKLAAMLGGPRAIMILVPLLVLSLGATLTLIGQFALGATSRTMAKDRFVSHTTSLTRGLEDTLGQAEPLIEELARVARAAALLHQPDEAPKKAGTKKKQALQEIKTYEETQLAPVALEMRDLLIGRPGITQAYIAYPDGTFLSADPAGPRAIGIQVTQSGRSTSYQVNGQRLHRIGHRKSDFDPRVRDWYKLAEAKKNRVWSSPYTFFFNQHTGVTRSYPIYQDEQQTELLAVVGVDFDVDALTAFMAGSENDKDRVHSAVFTLGGIVLAYPRGAQRLSELQRKKQVPTHKTLGDRELSALVRRVQMNPYAGTNLIEFSVNENKMLASVRRVGRGGPSWYVATFSPERYVLRELYEHRKSSLAVGSVALFCAVVLSWFLARRLLLVRRAARLAQTAAREAQDQIRDLGSYRLVSRIGEGGMGEVWRASHRLLARQAAIKLIRRGRSSLERNQEQRERFRREAQAIAGLRSRNTIALYDYGVTSDGTLFYVMELLDGIDLNSLVVEHGPQDPERVRRILIQTCNSLSEAHGAQLVHRDVKPANLFLCREADEVDIVKVLDFGLVFQAEGILERTTSDEVFAKEPSKSDDRTPQDVTRTLRLLEDGSTAGDGRITRADHQLGTPAFMSPEQALGRSTDGRSDIYSLACVAFWLLCGKPPFHADTPVALMVKHIEEAPPRLEEHAKAALSEGFLRILRSCLEKAPEDRPQSAQELGRELSNLGQQSRAWSDEIASAWWEEHLKRPEPDTKLSVPPLRDAVVLPPPPIDGKAG